MLILSAMAVVERVRSPALGMIDAMVGNLVWERKYVGAGITEKPRRLNMVAARRM